MFAATTVTETSLLVRGIIYQPYFMIVMAVSSVVVWAAPQSWDWSRELTVKKAIVTGTLFLLALVLLTLQSYNPFIYFNF